MVGQPQLVEIQWGRLYFLIRDSRGVIASDLRSGRKLEEGLEWGSRMGVEMTNMDTDG